MKRFFEKLNEPFPESDSPRSNVLNILGVGLFITFFLFIFQIGGMHSYSGSIFLVCLNFGVITVVISLFFNYVASRVLKLKRNVPSWTLKKWIIYMFVLLILISIGNYAYYITLIGSNSGGWDDYLIIGIYTIIIGLFPVIFSGFMIQIKANRLNQIQAADLQSNFPKQDIHHEVIHLISDNKNHGLKIHIDDLLYIEAMQNYVSVCFKKEGKIKKELLRSTIKKMEAQLEEKVLIRCHRSFIVNSDLIENVEGNAQGLRLSLKDLEEFEVPVSRKYISVLRRIVGG